jgi:hypothetical protein
MTKRPTGADSFQGAYGRSPVALYIPLETESWSWFTLPDWKGFEMTDFEVQFANTAQGDLVALAILVLASLGCLALIALSYRKRGARRPRTLPNRRRRIGGQR